MRAVVTITLLGLALISGRMNKPNMEILGETTLMGLRQVLGEELPRHYRSDTDSTMVRMGYDLVHEGRTQKDGRQTTYISRFYSCTSCHNVEREDADLTRIDPDSRLEWAIANDLRYLPASTFWGVVNRTQWYNDDYEQKYGSLVDAARNDLVESMQLCAQECSQGRMMEDWEVESMLHYFSTLEVELEDLGISGADAEVLRYGKLSNEGKLGILDSYFLPRSPAHVGEVPADKKAGYGIEGRAGKGKAVYELGCQSCHQAGGESDLVLDDSKKTFRWLKRNITKDDRYSLYEIIRKGTYAEYGHREYMPFYTLEKLSNQQVEDLRAYIEKMAD